MVAISPTTFGLAKLSVVSLPKKRGRGGGRGRRWCIPGHFNTYISVTKPEVVRPGFLLIVGGGFFFFNSQTGKLSNDTPYAYSTAKNEITIFRAIRGQ